MTTTRVMNTSTSILSRLPISIGHDTDSDSDSHSAPDVCTTLLLLVHGWLLLLLLLLRYWDWALVSVWLLGTWIPLTLLAQSVSVSLLSLMGRLRSGLGARCSLVVLTHIHIYIHTYSLLGQDIMAVAFSSGWSGLVPSLQDLHLFILHL